MPLLLVIHVLEVWELTSQLPLVVHILLCYPALPVQPQVIVGPVKPEATLQEAMPWIKECRRASWICSVLKPLSLLVSLLLAVTVAVHLVRSRQQGSLEQKAVAMRLVLLAEAPVEKSAV